MLSIQKQIEEKISEMEPSSIFSISDVAGHIADKYGWSIVPTGDACLNYLGLSTQMPAHYEYIVTVQPMYVYQVHYARIKCT